MSNPWTMRVSHGLWLHPVQNNPHRAMQYPHYSTVLNLCGIEFPMTLRQISKFERQNAISINIFSPEGDSIVPLRLISDKREKHVNLLYVADSRNNEAHFVWIKDLSRLVSSQLTKHNRRTYICDW